MFVSPGMVHVAPSSDNSVRRIPATSLSLQPVSSNKLQQRAELHALFARGAPERDYLGVAQDAVARLAASPVGATPVQGF